MSGRPSLIRIKHKLLYGVRTFFTRLDSVPVEVARQVHNRRQNQQQAKAPHQQGVILELQQGIEETVQHHQDTADQPGKKPVFENTPGVKGDQYQDTDATNQVSVIERDMLGKRQ